MTQTITNVQIEGLPTVELPSPVEVTEEELKANSNGLYMYVIAKSFSQKLKELEKTMSSKAEDEE